MDPVKKRPTIPLAGLGERATRGTHATVSAVKELLLSLGVACSKWSKDDLSRYLDDPKNQHMHHMVTLYYAFLEVARTSLKHGSQPSKPGKAAVHSVHSDGGFKGLDQALRHGEEAGFYQNYQDYQGAGLDLDSKASYSTPKRPARDPERVPPPAPRKSQPLHAHAAPAPVVQPRPAAVHFALEPESYFSKPAPALQQGGEDADLELALALSRSQAEAEAEAQPPPRRSRVEVKRAEPPPQRAESEPYVDPSLLAPLPAQPSKENKVHGDGYGDRKGQGKPKKVPILILDDSDSDGDGDGEPEQPEQPEKERKVKATAVFPKTYEAVWNLISSPGTAWRPNYSRTQEGAQQCHRLVLSKVGISLSLSLCGP